MTIAAGFRFDKGLLLCADTQYSSAQKTHSTKIFPIEHGDARVILALTGREAYAMRAKERIEEEIKDIPLDEPTKENLHNAIESGLKDIFDNHVYPNPDWSTPNTPEFQFVVGLYSPVDGNFLLKTEQTIAFVLDDKVCLGSGAYLGDYLLGKLYLSPTQLLNDAVALATYLLHQAKSHDINCGGLSEFRVLWNTGDMSPVESRDIVINEDYALSFNEFSKRIFYAVADSEKSDDEIYPAIAEADEVLFLSLISRREKREQEKLVEALQLKMSAAMNMSADVVKPDDPKPPEP